MKIAKLRINPHLKHYTVRIEVTCWIDEGESEAFDRNVAATSSAQAIRKAGLSIVQNELREMPNRSNGENAGSTQGIKTNPPSIAGRGILT